MKASRASLLKGSGDIMADCATIISAVDIAVEAAVDAEEVPLVEAVGEGGGEAVEAKAEPDGPAGEPVVPERVEGVMEPAPEPAPEVAFDEVVDIVEFGYFLEGEVQYLDVSCGFWMWIVKYDADEVFWTGELMLYVLQEHAIEQSFDVILIWVASGHMHRDYFHHRYSG
jgi:hypothetical protein